jgi:hypothetical protein
MASETDSLIAKAQEKLVGLEAETQKMKNFINQLCEFDGRPAIYVDVATKQETVSGSLRSDQFYGRPLATVVREVLEMRRAANLGPASVTDIYGRLVDGGYKFDTSNEHNAKRGLRISLTKNPAFHKLPNGDYGLTEWYPAAPRKRPRPTLDEEGDGILEENGDSAEYPVAEDGSEEMEK